MRATRFAPGVGLFDASCCPRECPPREGAQQQSDALDFGDGRPGAQHVVILALDFFENLQAAAAEQFQVDGQAPVHLIRQRQSFEEQARARRPRLLSWPRGSARRSCAREQRLDRITVFVQHIERQIYAIFFADPR